MELADVRHGRLDRIADAVVDLVSGPLALVGNLYVADFDTVELARELADGDVTFGADPVDDVANVSPDRLDASVALEEGSAIVRPEVRNRLHVDCHASGFGRRAKTVSFRSCLSAFDRPEAHEVEGRPDEQIDEQPEADDR